MLGTLVKIAVTGAAAYVGYKLITKKPILQSIRGITKAGAIQVVVPTSGVKPVNGVHGAGNAFVITDAGASRLSPQSTKDVQSALNALGFGPLKVDGIPGPLTTNAIQKFQTAHGLSADGIIGDQTKKDLAAALAQLAGISPAIGQMPEVQGAQAGSSNINTCKDVQHALNMLGASPALQEDGKCGPLSVAAIKAFQVTHGLTADGVAGPKTKMALSIACNSVGQQSGMMAAAQAQAQADAAAASASAGPPPGLASFGGNFG
jgi:peptidoglycan hydrolase-like protein with peptidoglycan-binding domain